MTGKRTKHSFSFESFDNLNPYKIQESGVAKKVGLFHYSSEYFRKKKAGSTGTQIVVGGNIPWNMDNQYEFTPVDLSNGNNPPPAILCGLNRGSAAPITSMNSAFNLSPNKIAKEPCPCKRNPQYDSLVSAGLCTDGETCYQELKNPDGSVQKVPVLSELYVDCTDTSVIPEMGKDRKPNHLYLPTYQTSCSTHPRAAGYAHEDNYDCLKENKFGAGDQDGVCCDTFCGCMYNNLVAFEQNKYPNPNFKGKPGETVYDDDGNLIPENFLEFSPICPKELSVGFCCNKTWVDTQIDYDYRLGIPEIFDDICTSECNFGWYFQLTGTKYLLNGCPPVNQGSDGNPDPDYTFPDDIKAKIDLFTEKTGIEITPEDFYPYNGHYAKVFTADGNKNCGCGGEGGIVNISGTRSCTKCTYVLPQSMNPFFWDGGMIVMNTTKCDDAVDGNIQNTDPEQGPTGRSVCGCIFNEEVDFGDAGKIYLTTLTFPSKIFPNGSILEIDDNGAIRARGCGDEFKYDCNDIN